MQRLLLIDGSGIAYRSFFALIRQELKTSRGEPTGAVFGYTRFIMKALKDFEPDFVAVCFDTSRPTFRHLRYPEYKATREKAPDELKAQLPRIAEITEALGISMVEVEGYEADDVIGALAKKGERDGLEVYLVSSDKDFLQLVGENVKVVNPGRRGEAVRVFDVEMVKKRYGVNPSEVVDVLGLAGDVSDNVPGVPGVGEKTAISLVRQFGSVENVLSSLDEISRPSLRSALSEHSERALLSKELVSIRTDIDPIPDIDRLRYAGGNTSRLGQLFKELEFFTFLEELPQEEVRCEYSVLDSDELLPVLLASSEFAFSLGDGAAISLASGETFHTASAEKLRPAFESSSIEKISSDLKRDTLHLWKAGVGLAGEIFDLSLASYLLHPTGKVHTPSHLALQYLDERLPRDFETAQEELCCCTSRFFPLKQALAEGLKKHGLSDLYWTVEIPCARILSEMEAYGVLIDPAHFANMSEELQRRLDALCGELYSMAGGSFNLNSPKQLRRVLFDELGLPRGKRTKTGYSTDTEVLSKLALIHPFPKSLLEYREVFKLKSTYVDAIPKLIDSSTGRVHTSFNQTVTSTGRLSSSNPNLQNIPVRSEVGRRIRKGFVAPAGSLILSADYSQIELRILAHLSEDQTLIDAFNSGQDIHSRTAALVFGIPEPQITAEHRRKAKVVNFGIVYGMSPYGLAKELGISPDDAATFIEEYFAVFPGVKSWIDETIERAREDGFVKTMLNRVRHLPDINSRNRSRREFQERTAVNTPIQGTAADLMKMAMIAVHKSLSGLGTKLILQIHDELVLEVPQKEMTTAKTIVEKEMASPLPLKVPVAVEVGTGRNWYEAH